MVLEGLNLEVIKPVGYVAFTKKKRDSWRNILSRNVSTVGRYRGVSCDETKVKLVCAKILKANQHLKTETIQLKNECVVNAYQHLKLVKMKSQIDCLKRISEGKFNETEDKSGRVHSVFSQVSKLYRKFLTVAGEEMVSVDIISSQIRLLTVVLDELIRGEYTVGTEMFDTSIDELENLKAIIETDFYEWVVGLVKKASGTLITRSEAKTMTFVWIFGRDISRYLDKETLYKPWLEEDVTLEERFNFNFYFKYEFPNLFHLIATIKGSEVKELGERSSSKDRYKVLAHLLQSKEAELVVKTVIPRFEKEYPAVPFFTIHDNIVVPKSHLESAKNIMVDSLNDFGVQGDASTLISIETYEVTDEMVQAEVYEVVDEKNLKGKLIRQRLKKVSS